MSCLRLDLFKYRIRVKWNNPYHNHLKTFSLWGICGEPWSTTSWRDRWVFKKVFYYKEGKYQYCFLRILSTSALPSFRQLWFLMSSIYDSRVSRVWLVFDLLLRAPLWPLPVASLFISRVRSWYFSTFQAHFLSLYRLLQYWHLRSSRLSFRSSQ